MREIKFRAWDPITNRMINNNDTLAHWYRFYTQFKSVMQNTGLNDKNGKDIYEGDIVKADKHLYEVTINCYGTFGIDIYEYKIGLPSTFPLEIVGNIYETPELLNERN